MGRKRVMKALIICIMCLLGTSTTAMAEEYLLPESATKYLTLDDILGYTQQWLNYARNEIYARHGRRFVSQELMDYFNSTGWYNGTIAPEQFDESVLNDYERANAEFLWGVEYENDPDGYKLDEPGYDIHALEADDIPGGALTRMQAYAAVYRYLDQELGMDTVYEYSGYLVASEDQAGQAQENEYVFMIRSYTSAHGYYYVNAFTGDVYATWENPILSEYETREYKFNVFGNEAVSESTAKENMVEYSPVDNSLLQRMLNGEIIALGASCRIDLNADGVEEEISIEADPYASYQESNIGIDGMEWIQSYLLHLNDQCYAEYGENVHKTLYGVSLDGRTIALIVFEEGPSEDPICTFYQYDGVSLLDMGKIPDHVKRITVNGDRTISSIVRCHMIDTSYICADWTVGSDNRLVMISQPYYEMHNYMYYISDSGEWNEYYAYLKQNLTVYTERDQTSQPVILEPQHVTFPYTDFGSWVYVLGENGDGGWINTGEMTFEICTRIFEGLRFAG